MHGTNRKVIHITENAMQFEIGRWYVYAPAILSNQRQISQRDGSCANGN